MQQAGSGAPSAARPGSRRAVLLAARVKRSTNAVVDVLSGLGDGLLLGALDDDTLSEFDAHFYEAEDRYVDRAYTLQGLWAWEQGFVDEHLTGRRRVLVTGAGGGREVIALSRQGFDVVGEEPNEDMVRFGNALLAEEGHGSRLRVSGRRGLAVEPGERFDAVVIGWGAYTHLPGRALRVQILREAVSVLRPGDPLLCSFWDRTGSARYYRTVARTGNVLRRVRRRRLLEPGDAIGQSYVHFFTRAQVRQEFELAGLDLVSYAVEGYANAVGVVRGVAGGGAGG